MIVEIGLHSKQREAYSLLTDKTTRHVLFGGAAEGGKSWLGCVWLTCMALQCPGTRWFIGRDELKRILSTTYITFHKVIGVCGLADRFTYNGQYNFIRCTNGSRIDLLELSNKPSDPMFQRFGSTEYTGGFIEEAGEVPFGAFDVLSVRVGRHLNDHYGLQRKLLLTANPTRNWLYTYFYRPWKNGTLPREKAFIPSLVDDNPHRESGSIEALEGIENRTQRERLRWGSWDYAEDPEQLISFQWIEAARSVAVESGANRLGVDVARYGDDDTVLSPQSGNVVYDLESYHGLGTNETGQMVLERIKDAGDPVGADKVGVDVVGIGAGVVDWLASFDIRPAEIQGGASPVDKQDSAYQFKNLRSQMWWRVRQALKEGRMAIRIEDDQCLQRLSEDLTSPRYKISGDRTIEVESKDSVKRRLGRSPDYADALIYGWCVDLVKPADLVHLFATEED